MRRRLADAEDVAEVALQQQHQLEERISLMRARADAQEARLAEMQRVNAGESKSCAELHCLCAYDRKGSRRGWMVDS